MDMLNYFFFTPELRGVDSYGEVWLIYLNMTYLMTHYLSLPTLT